MSFADAEARSSASVVGRLGNATATIGEPADVAGQTFDGIFDAAYQYVDMASGIAAEAPVITVSDADIPAAMLDALIAGGEVSLDIRTHTYSVVEHKPDGTGLTVLRLRK